jgi:hypothetical protein
MAVEPGGTVRLFDDVATAGLLHCGPQPVILRANQVRRASDATVENGPTSGVAQIKIVILYRGLPASVDPDRACAGRVGDGDEARTTGKADDGADDLLGHSHGKILSIGGVADPPSSA